MVPRWIAVRADADRFVEVTLDAGVAGPVVTPGRAWDGLGEESGGTEEQGIVVAGADHRGHLYVLSDRTCCLSPDGWGRRVVEAYDMHGANLIVAERNYGGAMVENTIRVFRRDLPIKVVTASRAKHVRFEPLGSLYEQGRVHHVGAFDELENEVTAFTLDGYEGQGSPNRADALVWAAHELALSRRGPSPRGT